MNILFYTPFNQRSRDTESLMQAFISQGHQVFLLTQSPHGEYHEACSKLKVKVYSNVINASPPVYFLRHTYHLIQFSKLHSIDVIYAHLETAALPAVLAQYFVKAKVFACRHVIDEAYLFNNRNFILLTKIVYRIAKNIIVVSEHCKKFMVEFEKINPVKIKVINLAYNFDLYKQPNQLEVQKIKTNIQAELLLLTVCRLVKPKRADFTIQLAKLLREKGINVKTLILGNGPEFENLSNLVKSEKLETSVFLLGYKSNVFDYLSACDILIHPSILDSSSVIVKEAGLLERTIIACREVGDLEEYVEDGINGFLVSKKECIDQMAALVSAIYEDREMIRATGRELKKSILSRFSISGVLPEYDIIHAQLKQIK